MTTKKKSKAYARAGVDVDLGNRVKSGLAKWVGITRRPEMLGKVGGFGGLFDARFRSYHEPVLVSSMDGVGTKLKIAAMVERHDTVGEDLVNHCVNDIAVLGAEPLFFLDYIGAGKLEPNAFHQIIFGLARACKKAGCALIGGETAQMPGLYQGSDYDLVGTIVGVVEKKKIIDGSKIRVGDVIVGFPSSGLHTNGYSLARRILFERLKMKVSAPLPGNRLTVGEELLKTHINYQPLLKKLAARVNLRGLAHITGGGLVDNLPRVLPEGMAAEIRTGSWPVPPIFQFLIEKGGVREEERYQVFNMGIGMTAIVSPSDALKIMKLTRAYCIGSIIKGKKIVRIVKK
ncbi:MAG: phosphoribosylformylglycinamidine cyclo-ligase [bacterium]